MCLTRRPSTCRDPRAIPTIRRLQRRQVPLSAQRLALRSSLFYGFTEMFNNALDHSSGTSIYLTIRRNAVDREMIVQDDGVGIFKKIQTELGLLDERHVILELAKGKLTTDPERHTGEGIFFSSRMFDQFDILSGGVFFSHKFEDNDWISERD